MASKRGSSSKSGSRRKGAGGSKSKAPSKAKALSKAKAPSRAKAPSKAEARHTAKPPFKKSQALTGGWLRVEGVDGGPKFHFFGKDFFLAGSGADSGNCHPQYCLPPFGCPSGPFSVDSTFGGNNTFGIGPSIVSNQYYETISYGGLIQIVGQGTLSDIRGSSDSRKSRAIVLTPFTLSGNLVGLDGPEGIQDKPELFNLPIHGSGIAVVELDVAGSNAPFGYVFRSVTYDITEFTLPKKL